jgi:hypothetical protein
MPVIQGKATIAGSGVTDNLLSGSQFEFLPYDAGLAFGIVGDANAADLRVDVYSGQDVLMESAQPSAQNRIPIWPDDYNLEDVAGAGERIKIRVRNLNAATRDIFYAVKITPV